MFEKLCIAVLFLVSSAGVAIAQQHEHLVSVPSSIKAEHEDLHRELAAVIKLGGKTGSVAQQVRDLLEPHFRKEEEYGLPPLSALRAVSRNEKVPDEQEIIRLAEKLKSELPNMLGDHKQVVAALADLKSTARKEGKPRAIRFAEHLRAHATTEEEILYPSAILVGEYLKKRSER
jgi:hypothetical protein